MSLFVIYFGTDKKYENMAHHEIIMGKRYKPLLDEIFVNKTSPKIFLSICIARRRPTNRSRPKAAIRGMFSRPCRISKPMLTGQKRRNLTAIRLLNISKKIICPNFPNISFPSIILTRCIFKTP